MIYVDTSVVLAELLAEDRHPDPAFWDQTLVSSRLLEYETWTRLHARRLGASHGETARVLMGRIAMLELVSPVLARALEPFGGPVRTLDALHLASAAFLREHQPALRFATYDDRLARTAGAEGLALFPLGPAA